jgi:hypothetical protein
VHAALCLTLCAAFHHGPRGRDLPADHGLLPIHALGAGMRGSLRLLRRDLAFQHVHGQLWPTPVARRLCRVYSLRPTGAVTSATALDDASTASADDADDDDTAPMLPTAAMIDRAQCAWRATTTPCTPSLSACSSTCDSSGTAGLEPGHIEHHHGSSQSI